MTLFSNHRRLHGLLAASLLFGAAGIFAQPAPPPIASDTPPAMANDAAGPAAASQPRPPRPAADAAPRAGRPDRVDRTTPPRAGAVPGPRPAPPVMNGAPVPPVPAAGNGTSMPPVPPAPATGGRPGPGTRPDVMSAPNPAAPAR